MPKKPTKEQTKKVRSGMTKKIRFEVFKRDGFKCQYCGQSSPDVVLRVDHINPVSKGGDNDLMNLITACDGCNQGKSDRELDDNSVLEKQRKQLQELNEKREQLEMMISWRDGLRRIKDDTIDAIAEKIEEQMVPFTINENGRKHIKRWIRIYTVEELFDAIEIAADNKLTKEPDQELVESFFTYIPRIAATRRKPEETQRLYYVRGILRNRIYINQKQIMQYLNAYHEQGLDLDELTEFAKEVQNWATFKEWVEARVTEARSEPPF